MNKAEQILIRRFARIATYFLIYLCALDIAAVYFFEDSSLVSYLALIVFVMPFIVVIDCYKKFDKNIRGDTRAMLLIMAFISAVFVTLIEYLLRYGWTISIHTNNKIKEIS